MTTSDWIQILSIFATLIISTASIVIALKSLKLTKISIESANRPYVTCYLDMVVVGHYQKYLIIKNFGTSSAVIKNISFLGEIILENENNLESLHETIIAPNQKFIISIAKEVPDKSIISVVINYQDLQRNRFTEKFQLNPNFSKDIIYVDERNSKDTEEIYILKNTLHEFTKSNL
ncbi:hypothetical protein FLR18_13740 [Listeria monocytogenes]|nr:hypothetical protein [Listeria monocytogenes]EAK8410047.1 hypothetical protein [Listeria monocytogenes]ECB9582523.1 hypothetical protein [Listeria monocytogenes]EHD1580925.1 hypothetical protein [Listeria monocytogenes]EHV9415825.1 hypothetical protein [Listeria monocytogenes]